jgi:two-component system chemotaxis sensor kinase CheA
MAICPDIPAEHRQAFLSEAEDNMKIWEQTLLSLEKEPTDKELLNKLFRAVHTLKGCAGFVSCDLMLELTHELESVLQQARDQGMALGPDVIELMFAGLDQVRAMTAALAAGTDFQGDLEAVIARARSFAAAAEPSPGGPGSAAREAPAQPAPEAGGPASSFIIWLEIEAEPKEAYLRGLLIRSKLEEVGKVVDVSPPLEDLRMREEDFRFQVLIESALSPAQLRRQVDIDQVNVLSVEAEGSEPKQASELAEQAGLRPGALFPARAPAAAPAGIDEIVRVPVDKLDVMMNLVGELVVQNSGFLSILKTAKSAYGKSPVIADLEQKTDSLARTARSLQDAVMKVRMLPVATIFSRFSRVVRDLAKHGGKQVELEIFGEQTEIDKKVMDRIGEPLIHLLRNSVDHGIEPPADRTAYGKEATGHIRVGAYQEGDRICIEVRDDGAGLDRSSIISTAVARGLAGRDKLDKMSDEEIFEFIFLPGFSTAREISDVSGRGVGMDVVRRTVEEMGGSVRLRSTLGLGVCTTITLPLTMAIINALLVQSAGIRFAIPLSSVREVLQTRRGELRHFERNQVIRLREEVLAVLELPRVLGLADGEPPADPSQELSIVIVDYGNRKVGLIVDQLKGREQVVIKSLTRNFEQVEGLGGASILGDGKLALILDVRDSLDSYYRQNQGESLLSGVRETVPAARESGGLEGEPRERPRKPQTRAKPGRQRQPEPPDAAPPAPQEPPPAPQEPPQEPTAAAAPAPAVAWRPADLARFDEMLVGGAVNASRSLSELLAREFRVSFPETKLILLGEVVGALGGEELPVCGVFVGIAGDILGGALLLLPQDTALGFSDLLLGREAGSTSQLFHLRRS